ncbi:MAG: hypothetical protein E6Q97_18285 [Desulfurellales bacterium]|nr:MAG: hypothetical protein E6Q97_18285 [Desulfurellales bacterium]
MCEFLKDGRCTLAESLSLREIAEPVQCPTTPAVCQRCLSHGKPDEEAPSPDLLALVKPPIVKGKAWRAYVDFATKGKSRGLGDTIAKGLRAVGITKKAVQQVTGKPCGCSKRQAALNKVLSYSSNQSSGTSSD